jgi:hypothetical protein
MYLVTKQIRTWKYSLTYIIDSLQLSVASVAFIRVLFEEYCKVYKIAKLRNQNRLMLHFSCQALPQVVKRQIVCC